VWERFAWDSAGHYLVAARLGTATSARQQTAAMSTCQTSVVASARAEVGYGGCIGADLLLSFKLVGAMWGCYLQ
jgi:hypothetical protein